MKRILWSMVLMLMVSLPAVAQEKLHNRIRNSGHVINEILNVNSNIPQDLLDKAACVIVVPSVAKFAVGIGGSYGRGVMTCRGGPDFNGPWSAPSMMAIEGLNVGFQLGIQATDLVLLVMNERGASSVLSSKVKLGGDVSASAGPKGRSASAATDVNMRAEMLSYSRSRGLFAGVSLEGSTLRPDTGANTKVYGKITNPKDIVIHGKVQPPESAELLLDTLNKRSPSTRTKASR